MLRDLDVSTNARCLNCRGWTASVFHVKGNIVIYLLTKYLLIFNEPFFGNTHLTQLLSFGNVLAGSRKNTSKYRCFSERHMHKLPRLNGCGLSSERLYYYLSADEIFLNYNEPFYRNVSFNLVRSRHISKIIIKYAWSRCFDEHQMHKLPRLNSCGTSRDGDFIIYLLTKKMFSFNERLIGNTSLTQILSFWDV